MAVLDVATKSDMEKLSAKVDALVAAIGSGTTVPKYICSASDNVLCTVLNEMKKVSTSTTSEIACCGIKGFSGVVRVKALLNDYNEDGGYCSFYVVKNGNTTNNQIKYISETADSKYTEFSVEVVVSDGDELHFLIRDSACKSIKICGTITEHTGKYTPQVVAL